METSVTRTHKILVCIFWILIAGIIGDVCGIVLGEVGIIPSCAIGWFIGGCLSRYCRDN